MTRNKSPLPPLVDVSGHCGPPLDSRHRRSAPTMAPLPSSSLLHCYAGRTVNSSKAALSRHVPVRQPVAFFRPVAAIRAVFHFSRAAAPFASTFAVLAWLRHLRGIGSIMEHARAVWPGGFRDGRMGKAHPIYTRQATHILRRQHKGTDPTTTAMLWGAAGWAQRPAAGPLQPPCFCCSGQSASSQGHVHCPQLNSDQSLQHLRNNNRREVASLGLVTCPDNTGSIIFLPKSTAQGPTYAASRCHVNRAPLCTSFGRRTSHLGTCQTSARRNLQVARANKSLGTMPRPSAQQPPPTH